MAYTNIHRAFLQACSNHGTISTQQAYDIVVSLYGRYSERETLPREEEVAEIVAAINKCIHPFDQKIAYMHYDLTGTDFYVFVSLMDSLIDLQQNTYTLSELHYFRALLRELTLSEDHQLPSIACLNLTNESSAEGNKSLTKARAEQLLNEWEGLGYFLILDNKCFFGPKTIVEFDKYLNTNYADVITRCCLCNVTIFYGVRCATCPQILHKECLKKYLRRLTNCPSCKHLWTTPL